MVRASTDASRRDGFPHEGFPTGWFQVGWEAELDSERVRPLRYFDVDLVVFRAGSGRVQVLDAHCPHQGAHLGYGGWVEGEAAVCPFHGWAWSADGENVMVPSEGCPTNRRSIRPWHTRVANGIVWIWHDAAGREPLWDPPFQYDEYTTDAVYPVYPACTIKWESVRVQPQYVIENSADLEHLRWVHHADGPISFDHFSTEGVRLNTSVRMVFGYGKDRTWLTPEGPVETIVDAESWGVGYQYTKFRDPDGAVSIQAQTPIDADHCDVFHTVLVPRNGDTSDVPVGAAAKRVEEQFKQIERDFDIWAHLKYQPNAALVRGEAKYMVSLRRWCQQFYPDGVAARTHG